MVQVYASQQNIISRDDCDALENEFQQGTMDSHHHSKWSVFQYFFSEMLSSYQGTLIMLSKACK
jgi:hypothetical protein